MNVQIVDDIKVVSFLKSPQNDNRYVNLSFEIPGEKSKTVIIPMTDINTSKILDYIPEGYVIRLATRTMQAGYMRQVVFAAQAQGVPCYDILMQGYNWLEDGEMVFAIGDTIIGGVESSQYIVYNPNNLLFDKTWIKGFNYVDLFQWVYDWSWQGTAPSALLLVALSPFVLPIVESVIPHAEALCGYLVGQTGCGKTSYGTLVTNLFQGDGYCYSLRGDKSLFYDMVRNRAYNPILIDDLNLSPSATENCKKRGKLSELIQTKSASGVFSTGFGANESSKLSYIITAEETLSSPSSMNRTVVIKFPDEFNSDSLTKFRENNLFPALVYYLVNWICENRTVIEQDIKGYILKAQDNLIPYQSIVAAGDSRIITSFKTLTVTRIILEAYLNNLIKKSSEIGTGKQLRKISSNFTEATELAIRHTKEAARRLEDNNVYTFFIELFKNDPDRVIAKNPEEFFSSDSKCIFCHDGMYFFRGEDILSYMKNCSFEIGSKRLASELKNLGWIRMRNEESSYPLPKKMRKKYNQSKVRYYRLYSDVLAAEVKNQSSNIFEFWGSHLR